MAEPMDPTQDNLPLDAQPTAKLAPVAAAASEPESAAEQATAPISAAADGPEMPSGPQSGELQPDGPPVPGRRRLRVRIWYVAVIVAVLALAALIAGAAVFAWDRWYRYDDTADIQGTWYAVGTDTPITITGDSIEFTPDTTYTYSLDGNTKSLSFSLGNLDGQAHYVFADDRNVLVIFDGSDYSRWGTAGDDLLQLLMDVSEVSEGRAVHLPEGEGVIALSRTPFYGLHEDRSQPDGSSAPSEGEGASGGAAGQGGSGDAASAAAGSPDDGPGASDTPGPDVFGDVSDR